MCNFCSKKTLKLHLICMSNLTHSLRITQVKPLSIDIYLINVVEFSCISISSQYFHYLYLSQKMTLPNWNFSWLTSLDNLPCSFWVIWMGINSIFFFNTAKCLFNVFLRRNQFIVWIFQNLTWGHCVLIYSSSTLKEKYFYQDCMCLCVCMCVYINSIKKRNNLLKELILYRCMFNNH